MTTPTERPSPHPAIAGREEDMAALADEVRRLIRLTVTCDLGGEELVELTDRLRLVGDRLEAHVPEPYHARFVPPDADDEPECMSDSMPYDFVVGRYNPIAPPLIMWADPPKARGNAVFTTAYEGAPGWVHGAALAGAFDIVLTAANRLENSAGPTVELTLRFRRPTLLGIESHFEAWVEERTERRVVSRGQLTQNGVVTVEASGRFAVLDLDALLSGRDRLAPDSGG